MVSQTSTPLFFFSVLSLHYYCICQNILFSFVQVESIKKISEYVAQLRRVGKGHGMYIYSYHHFSYWPANFAFSCTYSLVWLVLSFLRKRKERMGKGKKRNQKQDKYYQVLIKLIYCGLQVFGTLIKDFFTRKCCMILNSIQSSFTSGPF